VGEDTPGLHRSDRSDSCRHFGPAGPAGLTGGLPQAQYRHLFLMTTRIAARASVLSSVAVRLSLRLSLLVLLLLGILPGGIVI
jgi:hypothetical protein